MQHWSLQLQKPELSVTVWISRFCFYPWSWVQHIPLSTWCYCTNQSRTCPLSTHNLCKSNRNGVSTPRWFCLRIRNYWQPWLLLMTPLCAADAFQGRFSWCLLLSPSCILHCFLSLGYIVLTVALEVSGVLSCSVQPGKRYGLDTAPSYSLEAHHVCFID